MAVMKYTTVAAHTPLSTQVTQIIRMMLHLLQLALQDIQR